MTTKQADTDVRIALTPSPDAPAAKSLQQRAAAMVVVDKRSHEGALEFIRAGKQLKRQIEDHWSKITRGVDDLKKTLLNLKRADLEPVEAALAHAERVTLAYVEAERRRQREEEERQRRDAEEAARVEREAQIALQEAEAARLEDESPSLSKREQVFVDTFLRLGAGISAILPAATKAGYVNPEQAAAKLMKSAKVLEAISSAQQAATLREQAKVQAAAPIVVAPVTVASELGKVAGTSMRTTYRAEVVDLDAFIEAYKAGKISKEAMVVDTVFLNRQATQMKELFEKGFPGCRLVKNTTIAG